MLVILLIALAVCWSKYGFWKGTGLVIIGCIVVSFMLGSIGQLHLNFR